MRQSGMLLRQIGEAMEPPVCSETVRQQIARVDRGIAHAVRAFEPYLGRYRLVSR